MKLSKDRYWANGSTRGNINTKKLQVLQCTVKTK